MTCIRIFHTAEKAGFEPAIPFRGIHAFQACLFNHSSISPFISDFQIASLSEQRLLDRYGFRIKILKFRTPSFISLLSSLFSLLSAFIFYFHFGRQRYEIS